MFKKILSLLLVVLMLNAVGVSSAYAGSKEEKEARFTERVRKGIGKLGTGTEARIEVKLRNKTKLKGYVGKSNTESFTVVDANGVATEVAYPQVKQVKGNNLSEGVKAAIFLGVVIVGLVVIVSVFSGN
jgi:hypothetical protein